MTRIFLKKYPSRLRLLQAFEPQDAVFGLLLLSTTFLYPLSHDLLIYDQYASIRLYDRNGYLMREIISPNESRGRWTSLEDISPKACRAAIIAEDRRFYNHDGIDFFALGRALKQNLMAGETVSGGSTITMQLVRNIYHYPRSFIFKILEFWLAIRLEHTLEKNNILEHYLNRIPFGNQTYGIGAASQLYFGKSAHDLSWAEAAFLMALPKSPTNYNPYNHFNNAKKRQEFILIQLLNSNQIDSADFQRAISEPILLFPKTSPFNAPHFTDWLLKENREQRDLYTSIDLPLQIECEKIVKGHIDQLKNENVSNAAVLIIDNRTGQIITMIGSSDYFDENHDGQYNAVFAPRQPGSAIKPFTYALAFDRGYSPASILPDVETSIDSKYGSFTPLNYDNQFHGPVRARIALACSYNVPAVRLLQEIGVDRLLSKLHQCGFTGLKETPDFYGHGLTLGNGEVTLFEITRAYSIFANRGQLIEPTPLSASSVFHLSKQVFSDKSVFWISDILSDASARAPAFGYDSPLALPFPCAVKTGTSSDYRDNWTVGFTRNYTVGVWVGNFDNKPMIRISGVAGAGPVFRDIMLLLHQRRPPPPFQTPKALHKKILCGISGQNPHGGCSYTIEEYCDETQMKDYCYLHDRNGNVSLLTLGPVYKDWVLLQGGRSGFRNPMPVDSQLSTRSELKQVFQIVFPKNNAEFKIDPNLIRQYQSIDFEVFAPVAAGEVDWFLNDKFYGRSKWPFKISWKLKAGQYSLTAKALLNGRNLSNRVNFRVTE